MESKKMEYIKFIFATVFIVANKLQVIGDQYLGEITSKQWLLLLMVGQFEDQPPTLGQVAALLGVSHQNTKQLALKLEKKDLLLIEKDPQDNRALRLKLTKKSYEFFQKNTDRDQVFLLELFEAFDEEEIRLFAKSIYKFQNKISQMNQADKGKEFGWITDLFN